MRIYLAGVFGAGARWPLDNPPATPHLYLAGLPRALGKHRKFVPGGMDYPWFLESYFYARGHHLKALRERGESLFLDSGAYSAFTQGSEIDIKDYARFIKDNADVVHIASNLDDITSAEKTYDNQRRLEDLGAAVKPVVHVRDDPKWIEKYLADGYDTLFLGGMVPESTPTLKTWLDNVWAGYLTKPDGTARVDVHGFGLTTESLMVRYPWFSVDSTTWVMKARFGIVHLDLPDENEPSGWRTFVMEFSSKSPRRRKDGSTHFERLKPAEQERVLARLAQLEAERPKDPEAEEQVSMMMGGMKQGITPECLAYSYGWREYVNVEFFRRLMDRNVKQFRREQEVLF